MPPTPVLSIHGALVPPHPSSVHSWGFSAPHPVLSIHNDLGGHFKKAYELVNLRALKSSLLNKLHIFQCMCKIFCVEFQRVPLKFHTKYLTYTLKDTIFIQCSTFKIALRFTSLYVFLNPPPNSPWDLWRHWKYNRRTVELVGKRRWEYTRPTLVTPAPVMGERERLSLSAFLRTEDIGSILSKKPFNHNLYIGIIIFPHIDNP